MKKLFLLLSICCGTVLSAAGQTITLRLDHVPLPEALDKIKTQAPYFFVYSHQGMEKAGLVTTRLDHATIRQAMDSCLRAQPFTYSITGRLITLQYVAPPVAAAAVVSGSVLNEFRMPLAAATIQLKGTHLSCQSDENGRFRIEGIPGGSILEISHEGYKMKTLRIDGDTSLVIPLILKIDLLDSVILNTGYQQVSQANVSGSLTDIDAAIVHYPAAYSVKDQLETGYGGLLFNKNILLNTNQSDISIRGRSTLYANPNPLIILDGFPYDGDLDNINPLDIERVTVLKDAASASVWGAFAGNGVIVINTKKGAYNHPLRISVTGSLSVTRKPDPWYLQALPSSYYVDAEKILFRDGQYNTAPGNAYSPVSPVVDILRQNQSGAIPDEDTAALFNALRQKDVRNDIARYLERTGIRQQYALALSGGSDNNRYYFSTAWDRVRSDLVGDEANRLSVLAKNSFRYKKKLEIHGAVALTQTMMKENHVTLQSKLPYLSLADSNGKASSVVQDLRASYKDTAGAGLLLDWNYRPLDERSLNDNTTRLTDYHLNLGLDWHIAGPLQAGLYYSYGRGLSYQEDLKKAESYYARNLVNKFSEVNEASRMVTRPVPPGGILNENNYFYTASDARGMITWSQKPDSTHKNGFTLIAGVEEKKLTTRNKANTVYGYDNQSQPATNIDYASYYPLYYAPQLLQQIPYNAFYLGTDDHFVSYFANAAYTYRKRYLLTAGGRKDISNLFGAKANRSRIPLWSAGMAWYLNREPFFPKHSVLSSLKLRATYGFTGNVDKTLSSLTTARPGESVNPFNARQAAILNPPNERLQWEKTRINNFGADFSLLGDLIDGTFEYYTKKGTNLIADTSINPTLGFSKYKGNSSVIRGRGWDLLLRTTLHRRNFEWKGSLWISHAVDRVVEYNLPPTSAADYVTDDYLSPVQGKPLYHLYSYRWGGLDAAGNPQGYFKGQKTTDYDSIARDPHTDAIVYNGPTVPATFGVLSQDLTYKGFRLSFHITFKLGYYFRRPSINYTELFNGGAGHTDFIKRWQHAGDEQHTHVPSMVYPANLKRDNFYSLSEVLVEKGDHIRWHDLQLSYQWKYAGAKNIPLMNIRVFLIASNLGILWKANKAGLDPDYLTNNSLPDPLTLTAGIHLDL